MPYHIPRGKPPHGRISWSSLASQVGWGKTKRQAPTKAAAAHLALRLEVRLWRRGHLEVLGDYLSIHQRRKKKTNKKSKRRIDPGVRNNNSVWKKRKKKASIAALLAARFSRPAGNSRAPKYHTDLSIKKCRRQQEHRKKKPPSPQKKNKPFPAKKPSLLGHRKASRVQYW